MSPKKRILMEDVRRALRPILARPEVWAAVAIVLALGAGFMT